MKRLAELVIVSIAAFCLTSCAKSFQDIRVTSCKVLSVSPKGLSSFDAVLEVGVDNPAPQLNLSNAYAILKMDGQPCLHVRADDMTIQPRSEQVYTVLLHGSIDGGFNPFSLFGLLEKRALDPMSVDLSFHGALKNGIGKDFEYKDIPLKELMESL